SRPKKFLPCPGNEVFVHWHVDGKSCRRNQKIKRTMKTSLKTIAALVLSGVLVQNALANTSGDSTQVNQSNQNSNTMTTATKTVRINGFDLNDIVSTVEAIQTDPSIARFEF